MVIDYGMRRGFAVRIIGICGGVGVREVKFRGYDGGEWVYGSALQHQKETDTWYMREFGYSCDDWTMVNNVGQYTGMKDKKGNEIYDNNLLQEEETGRLFVCKWNDRLAGYKLVSMEDDKTLIGMSMARLFFEVVGNVHESGDK